MKLGRVTLEILPVLKIILRCSSVGAPQWECRLYLECGYLCCRCERLKDVILMRVICLRWVEETSARLLRTRCFGYGTRKASGVKLPWRSPRCSSCSSFLLSVSFPTHEERWRKVPNVDRTAACRALQRSQRSAPTHAHTILSRVRSRISEIVFISFDLFYLFERVKRKKMKWNKKDKENQKNNVKIQLYNNISKHSVLERL